MTTQRDVVLAQVADLLVARDPGHPLRVGVDGVCGAGKSTFARDLAAVLERRGRPVLRLDSDGFHHPRARRRRNSDDEARGYYDDAYDAEALVDLVLVPLGPGGSRLVATAVHDLASDAVITGARASCAADAIVLYDQTFLQRGELRSHWDVVIWLDVDLDRARERGIARDADALGGSDAAAAAYDARYLAACRVYLAEESPRDRADLVVAHDDPSAPRLLRPRAG